MGGAGSLESSIGFPEESKAGRSSEVASSCSSSVRMLFCSRFAPLDAST